MRKSLSASVLLLTLCCPTFAGDMLTPPINTTTSTTTAVETAPEEENTAPSTGDEEASPDISLQITLTLVESLLAII
jgi:hypothetical protein